MKTRFAVSGVALMAFVACSFYITAAQQPKERVMKRLPVEENEPITITDIEVNGRRVSFDKEFRADDEWLRTLVVSIKNKSDKLILFASIQLQFPRLDDSGGRFSIWEMSHGNSALKTRPPTSDDRLVRIAPGETEEIRFSAQQFVSLQEFLVGTNYPSKIERVDIRVDKVIFQDDSMWSRGVILRRDSTDPRTWVNTASNTIR
jgi:hypothetical protein